MIDFFARVGNLHRTLSERRGPFVLFGVFMREGSLGLWDLVVSAGWTRDDGTDEYERLRQEFFEELQSELGPEHLVSLSIAVLLSPNEPFVRAFEGITVRGGKASIDPRASIDAVLNLGHRWPELRDWAINGMEFRRIVLYESEPVAEPAELALAAR